MKPINKYLTTLDKSRIYYEIHGTGFPLFLLHGNGDSGDYFQKQLPVFMRFFRVYVIDTRGQGQSSNNAARITSALLAEDLQQIMDEEHIKKAAILGFSDGANIALKFTVNYPKYVQRLVLNSGNTTLSGIKLIPLLYTCFQYIGYFLLSLMNSSFKERLPLIAYMLKDSGISTKALQQITSPTLVISGSCDVIKTSHSKYIARNIPKAVLVMIKGHGHTVAQTNSQRFNQEVLKFLTEKKV